MSSESKTKDPVKLAHPALVYPGMKVRWREDDWEVWAIEPGGVVCILRSSQEKPRFLRISVAELSTGGVSNA